LLVAILRKILLIFVLVITLLSIILIVTFMFIVLAWILLVFLKLIFGLFLFLYSFLNLSQCIFYHVFHDWLASMRFFYLHFFNEVNFSLFYLVQPLLWFIHNNLLLFWVLYLFVFSLGISWRLEHLIIKLHFPFLIWILAEFLVDLGHVLFFFSFEVGVDSLFSEISHFVNFSSSVF
jgi:hypothetical protein